MRINDPLPWNSNLLVLGTECSRVNLTANGPAMLERADATVNKKMPRLLFSIFFFLQLHFLLSHSFVWTF